MTKTREVRFETIVRAERERVFDAIATGWAHALTLMKFWVEHGITC